MNTNMRSSATVISWIPPNFKHYPSPTNRNAHFPQNTTPTPLNPDSKPPLIPNLLSLAVAVTALNSPLPSSALPSLNYPLPPQLSPSTPFSQSKTLLVGLEDGKIRPCPSTNPGCVSTNPLSSSFAFPWMIPKNSTQNALQELKQAILKTQKNAKIEVIEEYPEGQYLRALVDGGFGRDVMEFLVKGDVVAYRCVATKVTFVYPFTAALGDSKGQQERMKEVIHQLGWYAPSFDFMD